MAGDRQNAQNKLKSALNSIAQCGTSLNIVIEVYQELHPEVSEPLMAVEVALMQCSDVIEEVLRGI